MRKRSSNRKNINEIAAAVLATIADSAKKEPAAVVLGRLGGLKGGKASAKGLITEQRSEISKVVTISRWKSAKSGSDI